MKFLIDTNILIPAEPASAGDVSALTPAALRFQRLAQIARAAIYVHPRQRDDIESDRDSTRRDLRLQLFTRYAPLISPPEVQPELSAAVLSESVNRHDIVDNLLLASVFAHAVNYLVTEDKALHQKARRANIEHRVLFLSDAIALLENLFDRTPRPPPAVSHLIAHQLDSNDPIFESLRVDYPGFDGWLQRCKLDGRQCWTVSGESGYSAIAIVKAEMSPPRGLVGKVLKLCTFKVSDGAYGRRYGELLLKTVFEFTRENNYDSIYVTAFEKQEQLIQLLTAFGFEEIEGRTDLGEIMLAKAMKPPDNCSLRGLEFNVAFGPHHVDWNQDAAIVPIQPRYHRMLFPEQDAQGRFATEHHPFGNALRKAYLCNSKLRGLAQGSLIWFYRSREGSGIVACGVVEGWIRNSNPEIVAQFVGRRTVYSFEEIKRLTRTEVLAITFRQARLIDPPIRLEQLVNAGVLNGPPQSIVRLGTQGATWLANQIQ